MGRKPGLLTVGALQVLREMRDQDEELVFEVGAGWWVGLRRTSGRVAFELMRYALIRQTDFGGGRLERHVINEEGRMILDDPTYVPLSLRQPGGIGLGVALRSRKDL